MECLYHSPLGKHAIIYLVISYSGRLLYLNFFHHCKLTDAHTCSVQGLPFWWGKIPEVEFLGHKFYTVLNFNKHCWISFQKAIAWHFPPAMFVRTFHHISASPHIPLPAHGTWANISLLLGVYGTTGDLNSLLTCFWSIWTCISDCCSLLFFCLIFISLIFGHFTRQFHIW